MTYDECVIWLKTMLTVALNDEDSNFTRIIPAMFLYADGRIYRDLVFLATRVTQPITLVRGDREFILPSSVRVLQNINVLVWPRPHRGIIRVRDWHHRRAHGRYPKRVPLERISLEALDYFWPDASFRLRAPEKYAVTGNVQPALPLAAGTSATPQTISHVVRLMPSPDRRYQAELIGDIRPEPLSPENPETYLSVFYPELFLCACMVFGSGYQRDFGAQADDPQRAMSWESQYTMLRQGVAIEAARQRGEGPGFSALPPAPAAQQPRAP